MQKKTRRVPAKTDTAVNGVPVYLKGFWIRIHFMRIRIQCFKNKCGSKYLGIWMRIRNQALTLKSEKAKNNSNSLIKKFYKHEKIATFLQKLLMFYP